MATRILLLSFFMLLSTASFAGEPGKEPAPRQPAAVAVDTDYFTAFGDFLLWDATEDHLDWAIVCQGFGAINSDCAANELNPNWKGGFRVGGAYTWSSDTWDLKSDWTWYKNGDFAFVRTPGVLLFPTRTHPDNGGTALSGSGVWALQFNSIDLELGKTFKPGQFFTLRPHSGLKGAMIDQNVNTAFVGTSITGSPLIQSSTESNDFIGIGYRGGFDAAYDLGSGFSIVGKASASILWGEFKTHALVNWANAALPVITVANVQDHFQSTKAVLEGALGLNYHTTFLGDEYPLNFYALYEDQEWYGQDQFIRFMGDTADDGKFKHPNGDLGLNGVTFGMAVSF